MKDGILGLSLLDYRMVDTQASLAAAGQVMRVLGHINTLWNISHRFVQPSVRIAIYRTSVVSTRT